MAAFYLEVLEYIKQRPMTQREIMDWFGCKSIKGTLSYLKEKGLVDTGRVRNQNRHRHQREFSDVYFWTGVDPESNAELKGGR